MSNSVSQILSVSSSNRVEFIDITDKVASSVKKSEIKDGVCIVYVPHTTAAVTINENADPSVVSDIIAGLERVVPARIDYEHAEGNSPAHIKSSLIGSSVSVFVENGKLVLGTWQGIYFCEFDGGRERKIYVKIIKD